MSRVASIGLLLLVLALGGCAFEPDPPAPEPVHPAALVASSWQLAAMDGRAIPAAVTLIVRFGAADLRGDGPCNRYGAGYRYDPSTGVIRIEPLVSTKRACPDGQATALEAGSFRVLQAATVVTFGGPDALLIEGPGGQLAFVRWVQPAPSQAGPS
ncbi:MAG TPA: META domain-containing protein [Phytomonospora sp.]